MGNNRRGAPQCENHALGQQFPFGRHFVREAIQDQVQIQFACDRDIKAWHVRR